jgi:5-methylcytosine-specific restriction endonuclease McrA
MRKYYRKQNQRKKAAPKVKQDKQLAEYYEKYIKLSLDTLTKRHQKGKELFDVLKKQLSEITPILRFYLSLDTKLRNTKSEINSLNANQKFIQEAINKHKHCSQRSFFLKLFNSSPATSEKEYKKAHAENILKLREIESSLQKIGKDIKTCTVTIEDRFYGPTALEKLNKSSETRLSNAGLRNKAQFKALDFLRNKEALIIDREEKASLREKHAALKVDSCRAYAASYFEQTRKLGAVIRKKLLEQEQFLAGCPYCGNAMGDTPHADHIYPISRGGLSTIQNMVLVCSECNLRKSDITLREFINRRSLNRNTVEQNLETLKKTF